MQKSIGLLLLSAVIAAVVPVAAAQDCVYDPEAPHAGCLDPAFGGGWVIDNKEPGHASASSSVAFQDENIIVGGYVYGRWTIARYDTAGELDASFGIGGYGQLPTKRPVAIEGINGIALQPISGENLIVASGISSFAGLSWGIARFTASGKLDTSFGSFKYNYQVLPFGTSAVYESLGGGIAVQSDGKIVSVGQYSDQRKRKTQFAVVRLKADGSMDQSFATSGKFLSESPGSAAAVAFQTVGGQETIVVAGLLVDPADPQKKALPSLVRFTPTGQLDQSFGINGVASLNMDGGDTNNRFQSLALVDAEQDEDKKIIAVGSARIPGTYNYKLIMARFDVHGALESTFSGFVPQCASSIGEGVVVQPIGPDYMIIVAGSCKDEGASSSSAAIWRLGSDGNLDESFGNYGAVKTDVNGNGDEINAIIRANGKLVVAGNTWVYEPGYSYRVGKWSIARYVE